MFSQIEYRSPKSRVTESKLGGKWLVDADWPSRKLGFGSYDNALAEAYARTAIDLRREADRCERAARQYADDPEVLAT